ncbi:hypothetical protein BDP27DRAFT_1219825 [Rhodocollybia butyracea]|uniref:Uncharacterized protein n=1 Tax=Rhodocollybia butyracea TaxID=206335 RepID=A0A9P5U9G8_9AGAR|nr:hypothetical protein BDP27DRAFT_1219825 [Rhodocollybia butyracea]
MAISRSDILANLVEPPQCYCLVEQPSAVAEREKLKAELISMGSRPNISENAVVESESDLSVILSTPLGIHLAYGLAYTVGSALGSIPPSIHVCLTAFTLPNKVHLTAGARAWSKHAHRSIVDDTPTPKKEPPTGWWGNPSGSVQKVNENALALFWKIFGTSTWRNLHWLPHSVLVYEVRIAEGYGMRWSQDQSMKDSLDADADAEMPPWIFRGFVEPMMENGHELGWRHAP